MQEISTNDRAIMRWLQLCLVLIFAMVILGGVTRLTGSTVHGYLASDGNAASDVTDGVGGRIRKIPD